MGVGYAALYNCMDYSTALRRSSDDIVNALHAGENWRADLRAASGRIQLETSQADQIIRLPGTRGEVSYRFADHTIFRRLGNNEWSAVLARVKASTFTSESRHNLTAWQWELELQARPNKFTRILPLFTFIAVPAGGLPK
jgi:hypothetical protein